MKRRITRKRIQRRLKKDKHQEQITLVSYFTIQHILENYFDNYDGANKKEIYSIINYVKQQKELKITTHEMHHVIVHLCNEISDMGEEIKLFRETYNQKYDKYKGLVSIEKDAKEYE